MWGLTPENFGSLHSERYIPEGIIRGYVVALTEIVIRLLGEQRDALSAYGRVRTPPVEVRRLACQQQLLLKVDLADPHSVVLHMLRHRNGA